VHVTYVGLNATQLSSWASKLFETVPGPQCYYFLPERCSVLCQGSWNERSILVFLCITEFRDQVVVGPWSNDRGVDWVAGTFSPYSVPGALNTTSTWCLQHYCLSFARLCGCLKMKLFTRCFLWLPHKWHARCRSCYLLTHYLLCVLIENDEGQ